MSKEINPEFIEQCLKVHNKYRALHGSPDLKIEEELNKFAQEWAESLAKQDKAEHRDQDQYGENIYAMSNTDPEWKGVHAEDAVKSWYDEVALYKFGEDEPKDLTEVGHFTQVVWKETLKVGVGLATSTGGTVYVVCNYDPPGNVVGQFPKSVPPSKVRSKKRKRSAPGPGKAKRGQ
ncbi:Golgi-associated plant pathogenesis-related protein 1 [Orussus abietinus]|uniref:Golgi-associated plant pathogenesis-related protein 1 n=1 Tax=Orussus abietinus TaxID=222816 RepID=UPI0006262276|nr:Golgi-associated plant pathogenesis-related protein 1 [Orussus abietinus]